MFQIDKRVLNFLVIISLTVFTFYWTSFIFRIAFDWYALFLILVARGLASVFIYKDYSHSWSKATPKSFLIKSFVYISAFIVYFPFLYGELRLSFLVSELFFYLFSINFAMYFYFFYMNRSKIIKTKSLVIYGAGKAGMKLEEEFKDSEYRIKYFVDDNEVLQKRTIDAIPIYSLSKIFEKEKKYDLLIIAMPSAPKERISEIYEKLNLYFKKINVLPSLENILSEEKYSKQLKDITVEDLLARHPKDLDTKKIESFIKDKTVLITGAGGSIGSEISRQCKRFGAKNLILVDHSEFNLYQIVDELGRENVTPVMQTVKNINYLDTTLKSINHKLLYMQLHINMYL